MEENQSPLVLQISRIISNFFNPLTSLFIYFMYFSYLTYTWREMSVIFLPILLITILPITVWIYYNVKKKRYTNMDVSDRNQRKSLYFFIEGALFVYLLFHYLTESKVDLVMLFLLLLLMIMQLSNYLIKSSMHTAFNVFVSALFFVINPWIGILWAIIAVLVGISRIVLKRHTLKEVLTGALIAGFVSFIYLYTNIQLQN